MRMPSLVAIDGPVASGKTSIGRAVATALGYRFIDTGLMYRAITHVAIERGVLVTDQRTLGEMAEQSIVSLSSSQSGPVQVCVNDIEVTEHIWSAEVGRAVSVVSQVPRVRKAMVAQQRSMAAANSVVMVGRDIGTVVLPDAATKIFLSASVEERTRRRLQELLSRGRSTTEEEVRSEVEMRDHLDSSRTESPLRPAIDCVVVETDGLSPDEVVARLVDIVHRA